MGLGNPGPRFQDTRHNAGFWFIDKLAALAGVSLYKPFFCPWRQAYIKTREYTVLLVKPLTYMNESGKILPRLRHHFPFQNDQILVAVDQMDLSPGRLRLKPKGSDAGHNGVKSLREALGTETFRRLTIGIGRPYDGSKVLEHVLGEMPSEQRDLVDHALSQAAQLFLDQLRESLLMQDMPKKEKSQPWSELHFWEHYQNELNRSRTASFPSSGLIPEAP